MLKISISFSQNSLIGDGFGGRLWYNASNYSVGSYSGYTICGDEKQLYAWGANNYFQLGNPSIGSSGSLVPVKCTNLTQVKYFAAGYIAAVIKEDNSGWIWDKVNHTAIKVIDSVYFVDAGEAYVSFVKLDGTIWSVGKNDYGVFGNGYMFNSYSIIPSKMNIISSGVRVAVSRFATIVLINSGEVYSMGSNSRDQLGVDSFTKNKTLTSPFKISKLNNIVDIKATATCFIALDKFGDVWTWGGEDGIYYKPSREPEKIPALNNIVAISGTDDGNSFFALDSAKNCYAWGACASGECSRNNVLDIAPELVATHVEDIMMGETFSYILRSDGSLWATGQSLLEAQGMNGSIWLNQGNIYRKYFTKINPELPEYGLCKPINIIDTVILNEEELFDDPVLQVPNAFSPNGDNLNDTFRPIKNPIFEVANYKFKIYNKWGNEVFSTNDLIEGWDGQYKGQLCNVDTYFYLITYEILSHKAKQLKGDFILIR